MSLELRRRLMVQELNEVIDPVYRLMIGEGYTREQMTEICGVDIISLFNQAKNTIKYNGIKYMKVTSCALPLNSTKINVPDVNSGQYWSPDAIYVFYENGVLKERVFSGGYIEFADTTSSKAIVYYARYHRKEKHVNFHCFLYSMYGHHAGSKKINVLWAFEPYDQYSKDVSASNKPNSHYNNTTLQQIHYSYEIQQTPELRNCSGVYGVLPIKGRTGNMQNEFSSLNSLTGIIVDASCGDLQRVNMGSTSLIIDRNLQIVLGSSANFDFNKLFINKSKLTVNLIDNAPDTYYMNNGVLIRDGVIKTATSAIEEGVELTYGSEITAIDDNAFLMAGKIRKLDLLDVPITTITQTMLRVGSSLEELVLPSSAVTIGKDAFKGCTNLASISFPETIQSVEQFALDDTAWFKKQSGIIYPNKNVLYKVNGSDTDVEVREGTISISPYAFRTNKSILNVVIPDTVTGVGKNVFDSCTNLKSVTIGTGINQIPIFFFTGCTSLETINYRGTEEQWNSMTKGQGWNNGVPDTCVINFNYVD